MHCHWTNNGLCVKLHKNCLPSKYNEIAKANLEGMYLKIEWNGFCSWGKHATFTQLQHLHFGFCFKHGLLVNVTIFWLRGTTSLQTLKTATCWSVMSSLYIQHDPRWYHAVLTGLSYGLLCNTSKRTAVLKLCTGICYHCHLCCI